MFPIVLYYCFSFTMLTRFRFIYTPDKQFQIIQPYRCMKSMRQAFGIAQIGKAFAAFLASSKAFGFFKVHQCNIKLNQNTISVTQQFHVLSMSSFQKIQILLQLLISHCSDLCHLQLLIRCYRREAYLSGLNNVPVGRVPGRQYFEDILKHMHCNPGVYSTHSACLVLILSQNKWTVSQISARNIENAKIL